MVILKNSCIPAGLILLMILTGCIGNKRSLPVLNTQQVTEISNTTAVTGADIINRKKIFFLARGVCWNISGNPALTDSRTNQGAGRGGYKSVLKGLKPGTSYHVRSYAISGKDTIYGNEVTFTTKDYGTLTDIEGNIYKTVRIGSQVWMAENLRSTKYNDNTSIPYVPEGEAWASLSTPGYCWFKNSEQSFKRMYGGVYNWYTVSTGRLCPDGWHVPSDTEWSELSDYLGGSKYSGGKLKERGDTYWSTPNTGATNETSFNGLPGGLRYHDGEFRDFGFGGYWWSSTGFDEERAYFRFLFYENMEIFRFENSKRNGFNVRCIHD